VVSHPGQRADHRLYLRTCVTDTGGRCCFEVGDFSGGGIVGAMVVERALGEADVEASTHLRRRPASAGEAIDMELIQNRYFQRVAITVLIATGGWFVRDAVVPGMLLYQHVIATLAFIIFIQIVWEIFEQLHRLLDRWLPFRKYLYVRILLQLVLGVLILLGIRMLLMIPLQNQFPVMRDRVVLTMMLVANVGVAIAINLLFISAHFIREWKEELTRVANIEKEKAQMQYHHLKNQVNPHFLFNALTSLDTLVKTDGGLASQYIRHLSKVYRYVLEHEESEVVSLQTELAFIHHYLSLQQIRFRDGLVIDMLISPNAREKKIVMVTLQMLVDNAIKHNEIAADRPLTIGVYDHDGFLCVTNNKQKKDLMGSSTRQGLEQLTTLYAYLTERPVRVLETEKSFTVEIPLL